MRRARSPRLQPVARCPACHATAARSVGSAPGGIEILRCVACGLVRASATYSVDYLDGDYYGARAGGQAEDAAYLLARKRRAVALFDRLSEGAIAHPPPGAAALDVGCGTGTLLDALAEHGWRTEGVERSPGAAAIAGQRHAIHDVDVESPTADLGARYGLVLMTHVLEHLRDAAAGLRFAARHLAPGGRLVVEVPNWNDWARPLWGTRYRPLELGDHVAFFDRASLGDALRRAELGVERIWAGPQGATMVMPSVLTAADLIASLRRRASRSEAGVAGPRATTRRAPSRVRDAILRGLDRLDPVLEVVAGREAGWGANLVAIAAVR